MSKENILYVVNSKSRRCSFTPPKPYIPIAEFKEEFSEKSPIIVVLGGDSTAASVISTLAANENENSRLIIPLPCGNQNNAAKIAGTYRNFPNHPTPENVQVFTKEYLNSPPPFVQIQALVIELPGEKLATSGWYVDVTPEGIEPLSKTIEDKINKARQKWERNGTARLLAIAQGFFEWIRGFTPLIFPQIQKGQPNENFHTIQHTFSAYPFGAYGRAVFASANQETCFHITFGFPGGMNPRKALLKLNCELLLWQIQGGVPRNTYCIKIQPLTSFSFEKPHNLHIDSLVFFPSNNISSDNIPSEAAITITPQKIHNLRMPIAK